LKYLGIPIKLSETPGRLATAPPLFGEHNREVLADLGFSDRAIADLERDDAIKTVSRGAATAR
jgi:crotonobetainyl-CoA:carnitine CoA-transferase CaiB-like acyl-CoA transferase